MIICNIKGGIGNQLFQYACARAISKKHGIPVKIDIQDATRHNQVSDVPRKLSILELDIDAEIATAQEAQAARYEYGLLSKLSHRITTKIGLRTEELNFDKSILENNKSRYLDGYFQSYKYFEDIRDTIHTEFSLKNASEHFNLWCQKIRQNANPVSIHIRRGDYVQKESVRNDFGPCGLDYFQRAMSLIEKEQTDISYIVFSDDIIWVKENLQFTPGLTVTYVEDPSLLDIEELLLMSTCNHNIISNSSFSWWAAWLNKNPSKIVITPTPWFDSGSINEEDLLPPAWTRIAKYS